MKWQMRWRPALLVLVVAVSATAGWFTLRRATAKQHAEPVPRAPAVSTSVEPEKQRVLLSAAKLGAAEIQTQVVAKHDVPDHRVVPGRLQYDDRRHVAVRVVTAGIVMDVRVGPGDKVQPGQTLALVNSPEVGDARADEMKRKAELEMAQRKHQWESQIAKSLKPFVAAIQQRLDPKELQDQFRTTVLGEHREKLVSAYMRFVLADSLLRTGEAVSAAGVLASRTMQERSAEQQAARAAVTAACEQALFDAEQRADLASLTAADAQRRWDISRQHLRALLGYEPGKDEVKADADLSRIEILAPFAGTIERRGFSVSERVQPNDELFILADTSTLWVVADVREQDWAAIALRPGQTMSIHVPALPDRQFTAKVHFVGREVSEASNAVSIVAEIDNQEGSLRPGLFVQATLSVKDTAPVLAVPSSAVMTHNQRTFVFVRENEHSFRRMFVETGREANDWTEIRSGLEVGDDVVIHGAFILKSELLLEAEE